MPLPVKQAPVPSPPWVRALSLVKVLCRPTLPVFESCRPVEKSTNGLPANERSVWSGSVGIAAHEAERQMIRFNAIIRRRLKSLPRGDSLKK